MPTQEQAAKAGPAPTVESDGAGPREHPRAAAPAPRRFGRRGLLIAGLSIAALGLVAVIGWPFVDRWFHTSSTDDAYVNGHVSLVAPRIDDQVVGVYAEDNDHVMPDTVLVRLDRRPYEVAVAQKQAQLAVSEADLEQARVAAAAQEARARSSWYSLKSAQEQVRLQVATLESDVTNLKVQQANLTLARREFERVANLLRRAAGTVEEYDQRRDTLEVARQQVADAEARIRRTRAGLGIEPKAEDPLQIPPNLEEIQSGVQTSLSATVEALAQLGFRVQLHNLKPSEFYEQLQKLDPGGDLNKALDRLVRKAPSVLYAEARVGQARRDLEQAELNLSYTEIKAPIDGFVIRRNVNPGNHVQPGQVLMAVRSLREIWVDANFKETELGGIRIGLPATITADAYPGRVFKARVAGFSPGTGATLALLPPQNATGNFVKIVQRLPVRLELTEPNPSDAPLFIGLSVVPEIDLRGRPAGPNAGRRLIGPGARQRPTGAVGRGASGG